MMATINAGIGLRGLISVDSTVARRAILQARNANPRWDPTMVAGSTLSSPWSEFVASHMGSVDALLQGRCGEAYDKAVLALQPFLRVFREDEGAWVVQPMHSVVHNLRAIAENADAEARAQGKKATRLGDCGDQLRKCFSVSLQAPNNKDKKLAALDIVNVSIKIYFKLNTLRLCKNLIRTVDSRQFAAFDAFPASQRVTYMFYKGRLAIFDENYAEAQDTLTYALGHCHPAAQRNRARIIKYLVPVGLLLGKLPSTKLQEQYRSVLQLYEPLMKAMRTGDIGLFYSTLNEHQSAFIRDGTFLLLEKLQAAVQRRLLRRVWAVHAEVDPPRTAQIPLEWYRRAFEVCGVSIEMDEVECIGVNLIFRRYVRGYIAHRSKIMVVAKTNPFPPLEQASITES